MKTYYLFLIILSLISELRLGESVVQYPPLVMKCMNKLINTEDYKNCVKNFIDDIDCCNIWGKLWCVTKKEECKEEEEAVEQFKNEFVIQVQNGKFDNCAILFERKSNSRKCVQKLEKLDIS
jgi:hypothetical protein